MKYLALRQLEPMNRALVFDTPDCRVIGGCEIYTTKAAGTDKKLYKTISTTLTTRYEADRQLSDTLSPPLQSKAVYASLHSPFGPLDHPSARKTFAYLIATLNASHPDYDFSSVLRPTDFRRERSLRQVINGFNTTLFNLGGPVLRGMWDAIDSEMDLTRCNIYSYTPEDMSDDAYGDEGLIWSTIYFFYNKHKKRVCYLYLRGISALERQRKGNGLWEESDDSDEWLAESKSIWGDGDGDSLEIDMEV